MICPTCHKTGYKAMQPSIKFDAKFVKIKPGTFQMGSPESESGRYNDEVLHSVTLTKSFEMPTTPVTQAQYVSIMKTNPSAYGGDLNLPVEMVSWNDAQEFIKRLNESQKKYTYRLPTEAEWEYCARAGTTSAYSFGNNVEHLKEHAWFYNNADNKTHPVGMKYPNNWGLYDMYGNVWEWCQDWNGEYPKSTVIDPSGPTTGSRRVIRGGSYYSDASYLRSARRFVGPGARAGDLGFRPVRSCR